MFKKMILVDEALANDGSISNFVGESFEIPQVSNITPPSQMNLYQSTFNNKINLSKNQKMLNAIDLNILTIETQLEKILKSKKLSKDVKLLYISGLLRRHLDLLTKRRRLLENSDEEFIESMRREFIKTKNDEEMKKKEKKNEDDENKENPPNTIQQNMEIIKEALKRTGSIFEQGASSMDNTLTKDSQKIDDISNVLNEPLHKSSTTITNTTPLPSPPLHDSDNESVYENAMASLEPTISNAAIASNTGPSITSTPLARPSKDQTKILKWDLRPRDEENLALTRRRIKREEQRKEEEADLKRRRKKN